jgi:hypothetical protein
MKTIKKIFTMTALFVTLAVASYSYQMCYEEEYFEVIAGHTVAYTRTVCVDIPMPTPQLPSCYPSCN